MRLRPHLIARLIALTLLLAAIVAPRGVVMAHAELVTSEPATGAVLASPPKRVSIRFSEPVDPSFTRIDVIDVQGNSVNNGGTLVNSGDPQVAIVLLAPLPNGVYTVSWRALSAVDGHSTRGAFAFAVGDTGAPVAGGAASVASKTPKEVGYTAGKWTVLLGLTGLLGGPAFWVFCIAPALAGGRRVDVAWRRARLRERVVVFSLVALGVAIIGGVFQVVVQAFDLRAEPTLGSTLSAARTVVWETRWGSFLLARFALLAVTLAGLVLVQRLPRARWAWWVAFAGAAGAMLTVSASGHSGAAGDLTRVAIASDFIHLLATGVWLGGLAVFFISFPLLVRRTGARRSPLPDTLMSYSSVATASVAMLLVTGVISASLEINGLSALWETGYGRALLVKLGVAAIVMLVGGVNLLVLRPRVLALDEPRATRQGRGRGGTHRRAGRTLDGVGALLRVAREYLGTMRYEIAGAVLLLLAAAALTSLTPPKTPRQAGGLETSAASADYRFHLAVTPGVVGINDFRLRVDPQRGAQRQLTLARLLFDPQNGSVAESEVELRDAGDGAYTGRGTNLSLTGAWRVQIAVQPLGDREQRAEVSLAVPPNRPSSPPTLQRPFDTVFLVGLGLAAVGAVVVVAGATIGLSSRLKGALALGVAVLLVVSGAGFILREEWAAPVLSNTIPTLVDIQKGQALYQASCVGCHGATGHGDGPDAVALRPPPADLRAHVPYHTDPDLFAFIADGVAGTAMPKYRGQFSDQEVRQLMAYVRELTSTP